MIPLKDLKEFQLKHCYARGCWGLVEDVDKDFCRIVFLHPHGSSFGDEVLLARKSTLSVVKVGDPPKPVPITAECRELRRMIADGRIKVVERWLVKM